MLYSDALYLHPTDESALLPGDVAHIPLTAANHQHTPTKQQSAVADMLREDPRDTFYRGQSCKFSATQQKKTTFSIILDATFLQLIFNY